MSNTDSERDIPLDEQIEFIREKRDYVYDQLGDGQVGDMYTCILESLNQLKQLEP